MSNPTWKMLIDRIHLGINPFFGFAAEDWPANEFTFFQPHTARFFDEAIDAFPGRLVIEVGSFLGGSARHMARRMLANGNPGAILCIDTWLAEHLLWTIPEHRERLYIVNGRPEMYNVWMRNTVDAKLDGVMVPLPMASPSAARYLKKLGITAPVIYIDGCHETPDCYLDLALYWEILEPGGVLLIDDYQPDPMFAGLIKDVNRFVAERGLPLERDGDKVRVRKW